MRTDGLVRLSDWLAAGYVPVREHWYADGTLCVVLERESCGGGV